jgi:hypothetical protein
MKHKKIENPRLIGCLNCSPVQETKLPKDTSTDMGFGILNLFFDDMAINIDENQCPTVADVEERYKKNIEKSECTLLKFISPLHSETYEYNKEDGEWYLVEQGMGFA